MEKKESIPEMMHAWAVVKPGPIDGEQSPLQFVLKPVPKPKRGEVLVKVLASSVILICTSAKAICRFISPTSRLVMKSWGRLWHLAKIHSALSLASGSGFPGFGMRAGSAASVARVAKTFAPIHATQAGITMAAMQSTLRYQKDLPIESPRVSMT